jgi:V/A-type H+/Na+-transporting ATPase subunit E
MQNKLQELTDKIYQEGVVKAREEADKIVAEARQQASVILADAQKEATVIVEAAQTQANEAKRNLDAELKMTTLQTLSAVKQQIADLITLKVINAPVEQLFSDIAFIQLLVKTLIEGYVKSGQIDVKIILPQTIQANMELFFKNSLAAELNKGLVIEYSKHIGAGFKVGPIDNQLCGGFYR